MTSGANSEARPVFVVGMNGSGTTMLLDCLGRHPALYAFPRETRLIPYLIARQKHYGDLAVDANFGRLWDDVRNITAFRAENGGVPVPLPDDWRDYPRTLAAVLDAVFGFFAAAQNKKRWCEKTPQHVQHLLALAHLFPNARFVHVIRDGRDCAASFHRRWKRQPELTVFRWKKIVALGREQGERLAADQYLEVRYEDLTAQPEIFLRSICNFLGEPFNPAILESARPRMGVAVLKAGEERRGLQRNSGQWRTHFTAAKVERLERIAGRTLAGWGYDTGYPLADDDIAVWKRKYWSASETLRMYSREIWRKLNGELARPWSAILIKPVNALRHRRHNVY